MLVLIHWPARPDTRALLTLETAGAAERAERLLQRWRDANTTIAPTRRGDVHLLLRRRRHLETIYARLVDETITT